MPMSDLRKPGCCWYVIKLECQGDQVYQPRPSIRASLAYFRMDSIALITLLLLAYKIEFTITWPFPATSVNWYLPSRVFLISKLSIRADFPNSRYYRPCDFQRDGITLDKV